MQHWSVKLKNRELRMDIGVRLAYLVYAKNLDAKGFPEHELIKASPLFYYMQQKGIDIEKILARLSDVENRDICHVV